MAGGAVPALAAVIAIPIMVGSLGYELFAIVSLIISMTIFFFVYDFGIGRAMTFFISKPRRTGDDGISELVGSALFYAFILGSLTAAFVYMVSPFVAEHWLHINQKRLESVNRAFQIAAIGIVPSVIANTFKGMLEGRLEFRHANLCKMFSGATIFIAPLLVVASGSKNLVYISTAIVATRYLVLLLYVRYIIPVMDLTAIRLKLTTLQAIYKYGVWAALSGFISTMFVYGDRFIVARYLGSEDLSIYVASQDILIRYLLIPWSMAIVLMPVFSAGTLSQMETFKLYKKRQKHMGALSLVITIVVIFLAVISAQFLVDFGIPLIARDVVIVQMAGVFFCSISQLPLIYLYAQGKPRLITMIYTFEALVYLMLAPMIFRHYGLSGACAVWSGRLVLEYFLLRLFAQRLMKWK